MVRSGRDPAPIEPLFRAHFDAIFRYAAYRIGRDAALDVASETFAQALRSLGALDPERDARAWLFGIAGNLLRHHRRAELRRLRAYARAAAPKDAGSWFDETGTGKLTRDSLVEALAGLDARDRDALLLFAWADLSYHEIADAMAIPVGTVRSRIHRARQAVRAAVGNAASSEHLAPTIAVPKEAQRG